MKRLLRIIIPASLILFSLSLVNMTVYTRQCVDYKCHTISLPLYLKLLDFFDRHYNYKNLVKKIIMGAVTEEEKVMKVLQWTKGNIMPPLKEQPIIDDHIWYTIVRGYGARDQFSDIFSTLSNHAGVESFFCDLYTKDGIGKIPLSFVKIKNRLYAFDPYRGVYFQDTQGALADVEILKEGRWRIKSLRPLSEEEKEDYAQYFSALPDSNARVSLSRANSQSPLNRLLLEIKRLFR